MGGGLGEVVETKGDGGEFVGGEEGVLFGFDPREEAAGDDVGGEGGLELGVAGEDDEGVEGGFRKAEEVMEGGDVEGVLIERVCEAVAVAEEEPGPAGIGFGAEDPAGVFDGGDDEDAVAGDDEAVDP